MQFKHPELLYALFLLLIPIIVHLFQLRRFQKVPFTNVEFLKNVNLQTRKSQQLKKWLTLFTRLLLLACVILAFAQPFASQTNNLALETETVIYLDNSFSMQAKGTKGELLKRAIQDVLGSLDDENEITLFTNDKIFKKVSAKSLQNDLLQLDYSGVQLDYNAVLLKGKGLFNSNSNSVKNLVFISDFQQNKEIISIKTDSSIATHFVQLKPVKASNISIDSVYISNQNVSNIELKVLVNQNDNDIEDLPISLFNDNKLIAKTAVNSVSNKLATFTIPNDNSLTGKLSIEDSGLQFDNNLFFSLNERPKINVLCINASKDDFLKRVFTDDEFIYTSVEESQLNYNSIDKQDLIILNELSNIPLALTNALSAFISNDTNILIIPSNKAILDSYNQLLINTSSIVIDSLNQVERQVTTINYSHPIFENVFDKKITNFQYPQVQGFYEFSSSGSHLLNFEDGKPFLVQNGNLFAFSSALNLENSNFVNSPLIVPTLYNIGRQSFKHPELYYTIGNSNTFEINISIQQDDILKLKMEEAELIPQQRNYVDKVVINTYDIPDKAGIYEVTNNSETLDMISYNYSRNESQLLYHDISNFENVSIHDSVPEVLNAIKSATNINALWKWFAIFALLFLIIEMLILKFLK